MQAYFNELYGDVNYESVAYQLNRKLFAELSAACDQIAGLTLSEVELKKRVAKLGIGAIIQRHTKIDIKMHVFKGGPNAYVYPMVEVRNNPLVYNMWKGFIDTKDVNKLMKVLDNEDMNVGYVDLKNAKVEGAFTKIPTNVYISTGIVTFLTGEELAAVILHEVGHGFTFMQMASTMFLRNYALSAIADEIIKQDDAAHRIVLLRNVNDKFKESKLSPKELEELAAAKKAGEIHYAFLNADIAETRSETGCDFYDLIGAEYLADQFAARMGASTALSTALKKLFDAFGSPESKTYMRWLINFVEIARYLIIMTIPPLAIIMALLVILFGLNPQADIYDKPFDRIKRIRQQLVGELKLITDVEVKRKLLEELKTIDDVMKSLTPFISIIDKLWVILVPSFKKEMRDKSVQKQIEDIAYNELFVHGAKFETLA